MKHDSKKRGVAVKGSWIPSGLDFLRSRACAEMSPHGSKLLLDVFSMLGPNATRNGDICLAPKLMRVRGWTSRATLNAAVNELLDYRLLVKTRQGDRLDCNLFACTLYPLDCDLKKLDVKPGCYLTSDYMNGGELAKPPTEDRPAKWRVARKTKLAAPLRYKVGGNRSATVQSDNSNRAEIATSFRYGTKPHVFDDSTVPLRVTYIDKPSVGSKSSCNVAHAIRKDRPRKHRDSIFTIRLSTTFDRGHLRLAA